MNFIKEFRNIINPIYQQIKNKYNTQVDDFLKTANKDLKPGELPIRAMHLSWDKPSRTIKNKQAYNQFKPIFDGIHKKYNYYIDQFILKHLHFQLYFSLFLQILLSLYSY